MVQLSVINATLVISRDSMCGINLNTYPLLFDSFQLFFPHSILLSCILFSC